MAYILVKDVKMILERAVRKVEPAGEREGGV